jgi:hypothetical protein
VLGRCLALVYSTGGIEGGMETGNAPLVDMPYGGKVVPVPTFSAPDEPIGALKDMPMPILTTPSPIAVPISSPIVSPIVQPTTITTPYTPTTPSNPALPSPTASPRVGEPVTPNAGAPQHTDSPATTSSPNAPSPYAAPSPMRPITPTTPTSAGGRGDTYDVEEHTSKTPTAPVMTIENAMETSLAQQAINSLAAAFAGTSFSHHCLL